MFVLNVCVAGSRESRDSRGSRGSRGSRDSNSIEVLSAPSSPNEQQDTQNQTSSQIGRNPLRSSKCMHFNPSKIQSDNFLVFEIHTPSFQVKSSCVSLTAEFGF